MVPATPESSAQVSNLLEAPVPLLLPQVWRRRRWHLVAGLATGVCLGLVVCVLAGPWYESTAQLLIVRKRVDTSPISGLDQDQRSEEHLSTHMLVITSPRVVRQAVGRNDLASLASLARGDTLTEAASWLGRLASGKRPEASAEDRLTKKITKALQVTSDSQRPGVSPSNEVLTLSFRGRDADDCRQVLGAIIDSYQEFWKDTSRNINAEIHGLLSRSRDILQDDLASRETAYREFRRQAPLIMKEKNGKTIQQERLFAIDTRRSALRMRQSEIQASLAAIDKARQEGRNSDAILRMIAGFPAQRDVVTSSLLTDQEPWNAGRSARVSLEEELINLKLQEGKLLEQYGPNHPEVRATRKRMDNVRALIAPALPAANAPAAPPATDQDYVVLKVQLLKQELAETQRAEESLALLFRREQGEVNAALTYEMQDEAYRQGIERAKLLYDGLMKHLQELDSVRDYSKYDIQVLAPPQTGEPARTRYVMVLGFAVFLGALAGLASAWRAEAADQSFRTPQEIHQRLGAPVLAHIPAIRRGAAAILYPPANDGARDGRVAAYAEAYRALRTALYFGPRTQACHVLQITSADPGEGKTTVAANLAIALAESGLRTLLIDADLRAAGLHALGAAPSGKGLTSLLAGKGDSADVIRPTEVPGLCLLPSGPMPPNPADLLTSARLKELLDSLRTEFRFVLIDTPALLAVTDPAAVAPVVDGVLLTLRLSPNGRPHADKAREILEAVGATVLGCVVTRMDHHSASQPYC